MPGGNLGSLSPEVLGGLGCNDRNTGLCADAKPELIFYNLVMDRVLYVPQQQLYYFATSQHVKVLETIEAVYLSFKRKPKIEPLYLNRHGYYKGAQRLYVTAQEATAVMVALRLKGIKISIAAD